MSIDVTNPATRAVVGTISVQTSEEVSAASAQLRAEQPAWEALGPKGRGEWLRKFRDWLLDNESHLIDVLCSETGKPRTEAALEIMVICDGINYYAERAPMILAEESIRPAGLLTASKKLTKVYRPHPVVGVITPWNFPLLIPGMDAVPALLAGCAVLVKPSETTPLSALELLRGWREISAPPVLAVVTGLGDTGAAVVDNVDIVQFTGSTRTGRLIAARAGERLIPCCVELGGKDPALVLADADLERAANGIAWAALMNSGQACISVERVYVEASVHDRFVELLTDKVGALRQGVETRPSDIDVGAMATPAQAEIVRAHVEDAVARGATVVTGGNLVDGGAFFEPTVLTGVDHTMICMTEETFGPTIPVMKVRDADEGIRWANDSEYGLSATVWTRDEARGARIARHLEVGAVNINDAYVNLFCFGLPHGGWKSSGIGARLGGAAGMRKYCRQQAVTMPRILLAKAEVMWFPYLPRRVGLVARILRLVVARDLSRRIRRSGGR